MVTRDAEQAWQRRRTLERWDTRGGPSRWQRWKHRHLGLATGAVTVLCLGLVVAGVVSGRRDVGTVLLLALLLVSPWLVARQWRRERDLAVEWDARRDAADGAGDGDAAG